MDPAIREELFMKQKIIVYGRLDGMNELIESNRRNRYRGAEEKRINQMQVVAAIRRCRICRVKRYPIVIVIKWYERNDRRDPDNIAAAKKFILDALQQAEIIRNDGRQEVCEFHDYFYTDRKNPRIEVTLIEQAE